MTITPDQADRLKRAATDGPWELDEHDAIMNGRVFRLRQPGKPGIRVSATVYGHNGDPELIAAAPDLAQTIAGMRWEYAVEDLNGDFLDLNDDAYSDVETLWTWHREVAEETHAAEYGSTLVRRLAGPIEPIDKETP